jgi:hypothetical protein
MSSLKENYKFYDTHRDAINAGHIGDYVLIRDCAVAGYFKDDGDAVETLADTGAEPGTFIVHQCVEEEDDFDDIGFHQPAAVFEADWK